MKNKEEIKSKRKKIKILNVFLFLLLIGVLAFAIYRINLKKKLSSKYEAIRAAGEPVTFSELNEFYSIPLNVENSAYIIMDAGLYYSEPNDKKLLPLIGNAELPDRTESMSSEQKKVILQFLDDNQQCIELLHTTAGLEYGRYPIDFTMGLGLKTPHLSRIRDYVQLLALESVIAVENEDSEAAFEAIRSMFSVAGSLDKEPLIISQMLRISCQGIALSNIEYALNRITFSDEQLKSLNTLLEKTEKSQGFFNGILGERTMELEMIMHTKAFYFDPARSPALSLPPVLFLYKLSGLNERDALVLLDYLDEVNNVLSLSPQDRVEGINALNIKTDEVRKSSKILELIIPSYRGFLTNDLKHIAKIRAVRTALMLERYRLTNNQLPDSLDNLVPYFLDSVPLDPYDGKELRYKKLEKGFVVYSIGEDMVDDRGMEETKDNKEKGISSFDITFIIEK